MICGDCAHWQGDAEAERAVCRRYPPQAGGIVAAPTLQGPMPTVAWASPETGRGYFCGEWAERVVPIALNG